MAPAPAQCWSLTELPGLSDQDRQRLAVLQIQSTAELLGRSQTPSQQRHLAIQLGLSERWIRKWVALAELSQLESVGCQYCGLLLHAGVTSLGQLATLNTSDLHRRILRLHVTVLQRRDLCPSLGRVARWIQEARLFR